LKNRIYEYCPAKVNLFLQATQKRKDGYHNLVSLVAFTRFADKLAIAHAEQDSLTVSGPYAEALEGAGGDTILSCLMRELRAAGYLIPPLDIHLEKHIPLGGGLGGGSADGAGLLRALFRLKIINETDPKIYQIASKIGADLPICMTPSFQVMRETGSLIEPLKPPPDSIFCVLANPAIHLSTPDVFAGLDANSLFKGKLETEQIEQKLVSGQWQELIGIGNNLTEAAVQLCPEINMLISEMTKFGRQNLAKMFIGAAMSGSGASCFSLVTSKEAADRLAAYLKGLNFWAQSTELINSRFFD